MPDLLGPTDPLQIADCGLRIESQSNQIAVAMSSNPQSAIRNPQSQEPLLLCERVSKWYGPVIGVNQVTLELRPGITGLVGANGAGKTTLMKLATGQLRPDLGTVQVMGEDAWNPRAKLHAGYSPDIDAFYEEMSGQQFLETMARLCGCTRAQALARAEEALEV